MVGMGVLKGKLSNSWISYSINYFSCGPDQILTRRHVKALLQLTAWGSTVHRAQRPSRRYEAAVTSHPQPESRGRCIVVLGTPAHLVWFRVHRIVMATLKAAFPPWFKYLETSAQTVQRCVSTMILNLDKLTMKINPSHRPICSWI